MSDKVSLASNSSFVTISLSDSDAPLIQKSQSSESSQRTASKVSSSKSNTTATLSWMKAPFGFFGKKVEVASNGLSSLTEKNLATHHMRTLAQQGKDFFDADTESDASSTTTSTDREGVLNQE